MQARRIFLIGSLLAAGFVLSGCESFDPQSWFDTKKPLPGGNYGMDHSSVLYLMGPDGKLVSFYDEAISPDDLAKDLRTKI